MMCTQSHTHTHTHTHTPHTRTFYSAWRREGCAPLPHHLVCVEKFTLPYLTLPFSGMSALGAVSFVFIPSRRQRKSLRTPSLRSGVPLAMCRRYRGTLSCAVRASGGGGQSHLSCVRVGSVPSLGGGQKDKNIHFFVFSYLNFFKPLSKYKKETHSSQELAKSASLSAQLPQEAGPPTLAATAAAAAATAGAVATASIQRPPRGRCRRTSR